MITTGNMAFDQNKLYICISDIASPTTMKRRNGLKVLEKTYLSQLDVDSAFELLCGIKGKDGDKLVVSDIFISSIVDRKAPEIIREKAANCYRTCLKKSFPTKSLPSKSEDETKRSSYLFKAYIQYCEAFQSSFSPISRNGTSPKEEAEEIRLILVCTLRELLSYISSKLQKGNSKDANKNDCEEFNGIFDILNINMPENKVENVIHERHLINATSQVLEVISKTALYDSYPELTRECCSVIDLVAELFPSTIWKHSKSLLIPIVGNVSTDLKVPSGSDSLVDSTRSNALSTLSSFDNKGTSLLRHRHNKTRCASVRTSAKILSTYTTISATNKNCGNQAEYFDQSIESMEEISASHILRSWESDAIFDTSIPVRSALAKAVGDLLCNKFSRPNVSKIQCSLLSQGPCKPKHKSDLSYLSRLIVLLLHSMSDGSDAVRNIAEQKFEETKKTWLVLIGKSNDFPSKSDLFRLEMLSVVGNNIMASLLMDAKGSYLVQQKVRSLETMTLLLQRLEKENRALMSNQTNIMDWLCNYSTVEEFTIILCACLNDDDKDIYRAALSCSRAIGSFPELSNKTLCVLISTMNPKDSSAKNLQTGEKGAIEDMKTSKGLMFSSAKQYTAGLHLLSGLLQGIPAKGDMERNRVISIGLKKSYDISGILICDSIVGSLNKSYSLSCALLDVCKSLSEKIIISLDVATKSDKETNVSFVDIESNSSLNESIAPTIANLVCCCVYLLACPKDFKLNDEIMQLLECLSHLSKDGNYSIENLFRGNFREIFRFIYPEYDYGINEMIVPTECIEEHRMFAFEALVRVSGGKVVSENFDLISRILEYHIGTKCTESQYPVKLLFMGLLESIASDNSFPKKVLHPFFSTLLGNVLIPSLVWQVGSMASALRKLSSATLFSMLQNNCADSTSLFTLAPKILPILKSNLGDDDPSTRELVCLSLAMLFDILPRALGEEAVHQLYPDIIRCLDDSCENVRFAVCKTIRFFLRAAPSEHFQGTAINYITEQLFVHLDDPNPHFQTNIVDVLTVAIEVDSTVVLKNIALSRESHRTSQFLDILASKIDNS